MGRRAPWRRPSVPVPVPAPRFPAAALSGRRQRRLPHLGEDLRHGRDRASPRPWLTHALSGGGCGERLPQARPGNPPRAEGAARARGVPRGGTRPCRSVFVGVCPCVLFPPPRSPPEMPPALGRRPGGASRWSMTPGLPQPRRPGLGGMCGATDRSFRDSAGSRQRAEAQPATMSLPIAGVLPAHPGGFRMGVRNCLRAECWVFLSPVNGAPAPECALAGWRTAALQCRQSPGCPLQHRADRRWMALADGGRSALRRISHGFQRPAGEPGGGRKRKDETALRGPLHLRQNRLS